MTRHQSDIQDTFLNLLRKEGMPVTIYLLGGVSLRGTVRGFDAFTIELDTPGRPVQAVYKRSVASVVPQRPLRGLPADTNGTGGPASPPQTSTSPDARPTREGGA